MENSSAFLIASSSSGGGKSTVTIGLLRALLNRGKKVQPFKCGPDYIDPAFHRMAAKSTSVNLDTWMMGENGVTSTWNRYTPPKDAAVVEGVMGLFDGKTPGELVGSSADCARLLKLPVLLVIDAKGMAGTIAPIVAGFHSFHPEVKICGVIANRVGSVGHGKILAEALKKADLPPLLGALPVIEELSLPERHLGLTPITENKKSDEWFNFLGETVEKYCDIDEILRLSQRETTPPVHHEYPKPTKRIAVALDEAFNFYYEENFCFLRESAYEIVWFSPVHDKKLPENIDALYLGGGFPESFAKELSENRTMINSIKSYANNDGTVFAECGGFVYLCSELTADNETFPLCGIINGVAEMHTKRQALGYRTITAKSDTLFTPKGNTVKGHEFHYSSVKLRENYETLFSCEDSRGNIQQAGIISGSVKASYIHIHAGSCIQ